MIIGIAGYARVGKHAAAQALEPEYKVVAFADKLREFLYELNPDVGVDYALNSPVRLRSVIDEYGWEGQKQTGYGPEIRRLIQTLGTNCGRRMLGENIWVDATLKPYDMYQDWAVADVRFPNEAEAIVDRGGYIVRVDRPGVGPLNDHESETAMDEWPYDAILINEGSVQGLQWKMRYVMKHMDRYPLTV